MKTFGGMDVLARASGISGASRGHLRVIFGPPRGAADAFFRVLAALWIRVRSSWARLRCLMARLGRALALEVGVMGLSWVHLGRVG